MGWTELTAKPELDGLFKKLKLKYAMRRVLQPSPVIQIQHEGELDVPSINEILRLFPDFVYIELSPNITFQEGNEGDSYSFSEVSTESTTKPQAELSELERKAQEKYGGDRSGLVVGQKEQ